jgi:hypothetical protein
VAKIPKYPKSLLKRSGNPVFGAAGIGILAFRQLSGIAAVHKIVKRFYLSRHSFKLVFFVIGKVLSFNPGCTQSSQPYGYDLHIFDNPKV